MATLVPWGSCATDCYPPRECWVQFPRMQIQPPIPSLRHFCRATAQVAAPQIFGRTPQGQRRMVPIRSGRFEGELEGTILAGGADWQVASDDGITYLEARYSIETPDGALILVHNRGIRHGSPEILAQLLSGESVDPAKYYFRSAPSFETADERYAWLNRIVAVCSGARTIDSVILDFYEVL